MERNKKNFGFAPWTMKEMEVEKFIMVTTINRPSIIVYGRILYVIERVGRMNIFKGTITVDPHFTRGRWRYPWKPWQVRPNNASHFITTFPDDMNYDDYLKTNKALIDKFISEEQLYIKPTDPLLVYFKE